MIHKLLFWPLWLNTLLLVISLESNNLIFTIPNILSGACGLALIRTIEEKNE